MPLMEEGRISTLIRGESAELRDQGQQRITEVEIRIYDDGRPPQPQLIIETPECEFDLKDRRCYSSGLIRLREADGQYTLTGRGFSWRQGAAKLTISNEVQTIIKPAGAEPGRLPIEIRSERFDYDRNTDIGIYQGKVTADQGDRFALQCRRLSVWLNKGEQDERQIEAAGGIVIRIDTEANQFVLTGESASYLARDEQPEILTLKGQPTWQADRYRGSGNTVLIENLNTEPIVKVQGQARMTLPEPTDSPDPSLIELQAENYVLMAEAARFSGGVQAQSENGWRLQSRNLVALLTNPERKPQKITAEENVRIVQETERGKTEIDGEFVTFVPREDGRLEVTVTERARIAFPEFAAQGDRIHLVQGDKELAVDADGHVRVDLQRFLSADGTLLSLLPQINAKPAKPSEMRIEADHAVLGSGKGRFEGKVQVVDVAGALHCGLLELTFGRDYRTLRNLKAIDRVRVVHSQGQLTCGQLAAFFSATSNALNRLEAKREVEIQSSKGVVSGESAIWETETGQIELTGDVALRTRIDSSSGPRTILATADRLLWNQLLNTYQATGKYRSRTVPQ